MAKYTPQTGTRFQRLLSVTMSGGERTTRRNRGSIIADTVAAIAFVILILFIWVALP